jgi:hypothetical protein
MKQILPKNMKKINLNLFNMGSRRKEENISSKVVDQVPNHVKKMIDIKYRLNKMEKRIGNGRTEVNQMIKNANISLKYKRDYFQTSNNTTYMDDQPSTYDQSPIHKNKSFMVGSPAIISPVSDRYDNVKKQTLNNFGSKIFIKLPI